MAKLEELSELLVSEIRNFEEAVKRLGEIQKEKIHLDITELQLVLNRHEKALVNSGSEAEKRLKQIEAIIEQSKIYSKWIVVIFVMITILNFIALLFF